MKRIRHDRFVGVPWHSRRSRQSPIHRDDLPGDVRRGVGREERDDLRDLADVADRPIGNAAQCRLPGGARGIDASMSVSTSRVTRR